MQVVGVDAATGLAAVVIEGQEATGEHPLEPAHMATFTYEEGERIRALHLETGELIFGDFERAGPMLGLLVVYVLLVVGIAWWRGLGALLGLAAAFGIVIFFTVPALFEGADPLITGLVTGTGALAVLLYLAHGLNARTTTAYLGTLARLGVLNDVTVTQSSAIWELRAARTLAGGTFSVAACVLAVTISLPRCTPLLRWWWAKTPWRSKTSRIHPRRPSLIQRGHRRQ